MKDYYSWLDDESKKSSLQQELTQKSGLFVKKSTQNTRNSTQAEHKQSQKSQGSRSRNGDFTHLESDQSYQNQVPNLCNLGARSKVFESCDIDIDNDFNV
jgi:hypothetical protein